ncbi:unnamed protein product [Allacma fusca]|uniref:Solute carrier family 25 member 35 n=1 Tax=Allacma fusca TaxID=39272 RepID=A0A8J2JIQ2_9HEXA|nr:unnamed protein product [Allacma fusca]
MEMLLGGTSAVCAGTITNPLEVVKIRMQLQGELQSKGKYQIHYRNVFHAGCTIAIKEGSFALQKGLRPALLYQFFMNGTRLGLYDMIDRTQFTRSKDGHVSPLRSIAVAAFAGSVGGLVGSPFFLVKTQLQSQSDRSIAVGTQHKHPNMIGAFKYIYTNYGVLGLWKGASSSLPRTCVASAVQLSTFEMSLEFARKAYPDGNRWSTAFLASLISGFFVSFAMSPFDLISTRFYNQDVDKHGKGVTYRSVLDCAAKIWKREGFLGFYKGWSANYIRIGPHTLLNLMFWDQLKHYHKEYLKGK